MRLEEKTLENVKNYYGKELENNKDLKTNACCCADSIPDYQKKLLKNINDEVHSTFYGCGSPIPLCLEGCTVVDLGCGTGRDSYMLSQLVGENGKVIGIDMTEEQLTIARNNIDDHTKRFGYNKPNIEFRKGYIEDLLSAGLNDNSVDVVVSNCVINLSPDKEKVFKEIYRILKPGGEIFISDVFADRRIPKDLIDDPVLYGECLSGALYIEDFRRMLQNIGIPDYRNISKKQISMDNKELENKVGMINFYSITFRAFKLDILEDICEDYGQVAYYNGTAKYSPHQFTLDDHHIFETGKPMLVCGNSAAMVEQTRFAKHFRVVGNRSTHYGAFDCSGGDGVESPGCGC